jgi:fructose-bisphosphate aldolase class II
MLVEMGAILRKATAQGYGIAAPNVFDGESVRVCFEAANELRAPMVIDAGGNLDIEYIADVVRFYSNKYPEVPVALNLDHGKNFESLAKAIRAGFTSVMIDRSQVPFEENVKETAEVVRMAHSVGVSVEAELGHVGQGSNYEVDRTSFLTRPEEVVEFVKRTKVDFLAVAIGNAHGLYVGSPQLDLDLLSEIRNVTPIPLVLHGGSSTGDSNLQNAIAHGISKVNLGTDLGLAGTKAVQEFLSSNSKARVGAVTAAGINGYKAELMRYMKLFGEENRW